MQQREARIGSIKFESIPQNRFSTFTVSDWSGVDDGLAIRRDEMVRPGDHGSFETPGFLTSRVIPFSGHIIQDSPEKLDRARNRLIGLFDGITRQLSITRNLSTLRMRVGAAAQPVVKVLGEDPCVAEFSIQFWSADPRMYGPEKNYAGGQVAINEGNFPATPRLLIGAGTGGYTVTGPSGRLVTVSSAPAAAHEIDFVTNGLYLNGVRQSGAISVLRPWRVPVGLPGAMASINGARTLVQRISDTFI